MNPEENQMTPVDMSPDDAMAALALATNFSEQLQPQEPSVEGEISPEIALDDTQTPQTMETAPEQDTAVLDDFKTEMGDEMKSFKKEIQKMIKDEVGGLKKMIKDTLDNEEEPA